MVSVKTYFHFYINDLGHSDSIGDAKETLRLVLSPGKILCTNNNYMVLYLKISLILPV